VINRRAIAHGIAAMAVAAITGATESLAKRAGTTRRLVDMAGRTVTVPDRIQRIATLGAVPVINSFLFAFQDGALIVNGLPPNFARSPRWKYQSVFAPGLRGRPVIQSAGNEPVVESVLQIAPDVVLTMTTGAIHPLEAAGVPVIYLAWDRSDEVKDLMSLLGELLDRPNVARAYASYFDETIGRVARITGGITDSARPRVLYCDFARLTQPHLIAEWWIGQAGGRSVTDNGRTTQSVTFSLEQLLAWNPEVIIVNDARQVTGIYSDPRLREVAAVQNRRVYVAPSGAHLWTNRTIEEPLTVLWAAKTIQPKLFPSLDIRREALDFYARFFGTQLQPAQVDEILSGVSAE
jgi:iron complex transport system substrate-binding protein